jgi:hypothetical protein
LDGSVMRSALASDGDEVVVVVVVVVVNWDEVVGSDEVGVSVGRGRGRGR